MRWKRRLGSSLALLHLGFRWQPAPAAVIRSKSSDQVRGGPRINSGSVAFSQGSAVLGSRGVGRTRLGSLQTEQAKQAVLQRPSLRRRHREDHRKGQCLMGVKGLTSYVDQNLRAAAPIEHLREVRARVLLLYHVASVCRVPYAHQHAYCKLPRCVCRYALPT